MPPTVISGDVFGLDIADIEPVFRKFGITRLDTAATYVNGDSEQRIGDEGLGQRMTIDTKVKTAMPSTAGSLSATKIKESCAASLQRLKLQKVHVYYVHAPDYETPVAEQAKAMDELYREGKFEELGLCNLMPPMVAEWVSVAKAKGYVKPTWYQGQYNLVCRTDEETLFPLLKENGIRFAGYSPLGGGFLNGNLRRGAATGHRFTGHAAKFLYNNFYDQESMHAAFDKLQTLADETGIPTPELSLRWLMHHSALRNDDVVILGASKVQHLEGSMPLLRKGPLDEQVADQLNSLWTDDLRAASAHAVDWSQEQMERMAKGMGRK